MRTNGSCSRTIAAEQTRRLIGAFRKGEAEDPLMYTTSVAQLLASYPEDVVLKVTNPVDGLQTKSQWLPTLAEIKAACEALMAPVYREQERQRRYGETTDHLRVAGPSAGPSEESKRRVTERLEAYKASLKRDLDQIEKDRSAGILLSAEELKAMCSPEAWNAVPNL